MQLYDIFQQKLIIQSYEIYQQHSLDIIAFIWFIVWTQGYSIYTNSERGKKGSLHSVMNGHRKLWIGNMLYREIADRLADTRLLDSLFRMSTFFASTCTILFSVLFTTIVPKQEVQDLLAQVPFAVSYDSMTWSLKTLFIMSIFIFVIFKNTWVSRQTWEASQLILGADVFDKESENKGFYNSKRDQICALVSNATSHHNTAIRAFYFGFISITWYVNPIFFMIGTIWLLWVVYRREYRSKAYALSNTDHPSVLLSTNMEKTELPKWKCFTSSWFLF